MAGVKKSRPKKSATNKAVGLREGVKRDEAAKKSAREEIRDGESSSPCGRVNLCEELEGPDGVPLVIEVDANNNPVQVLPWCELTFTLVCGCPLGAAEMEAFMIGVVAFVKMYPGPVKAGLLLLGCPPVLAWAPGCPCVFRRAVAEVLGLAVAAIAGAFTCRDGRSSCDGRAVGVGPGALASFTFVGARPRPSRDAGLRIGGDDALVLVPGVCRLLGGLPGRSRVPGLADEA